MTTFPSSTPCAFACSNASGCCAAPIAEDVIHGRRLDAEQGMTLFRTSDIWTVCSLADPCAPAGGDVAYYNVNRHLNYSNICLSAASSVRSIASVIRTVRTSIPDDIREEAQGHREARPRCHRGGLHLAAVRVLPRHAPDHPRDRPRVHIKAFTAVEIVHLADRQAGAEEEGIRWVIRQLKEAGLGSMPGVAKCSATASTPRPIGARSAAISGSSCIVWPTRD